MYHFVYTDNDQPGESADNSNYIKDTVLEEQLAYLRENNYYYPSFRELCAYINGEIDLPEKSVILTFDDAEQGFLDYGVPLLEAYQVSGSISRQSGRCGARLPK